MLCHIGGWGRASSLTCGLLYMLGEEDCRSKTRCSSVALCIRLNSHAGRSKPHMFASQTVGA